MEGQIVLAKKKLVINSTNRQTLFWGERWQGGGGPVLSSVWESERTVRRVLGDGLDGWHLCHAGLMGHEERS